MLVRICCPCIRQNPIYKNVRCNRYLGEVDGRYHFKCDRCKGVIEGDTNVEAWRNGFYTASALSSTVGNMFRKKGSSPIKYMDRPIPLTQKEQDEYEYQRALEAQERIKRAMFSMMNQKDGGSNG